MDTSKPPFDDIRVRKATQLADTTVDYAGRSIAILSLAA
jgi:hypothetical protein